MSSQRPAISVLICTNNRHELLRAALESLIIGSQEKPDQIVVVNGGDERADAVVRSFNNERIELVKTVNRNVAASRNLGMSFCTGDLIAMTDDDAEVFPDWVTQMKRAHREHPEAGAVGGPVLGTDADQLLGKIAELITFPSWPEPRYVRTLPAVNISYKREVVERVGQQDEALFRGEDVDYNWRVKRSGYEVYFDPLIRVHHHHRSTVKGLLNQHYMYGRAYYLVRRKWPEMYCVYPHKLRSFRDALKAVNCVAALAYQPLLSAPRLRPLRSSVAALPVLFLAGASWRSGMLAQAASGVRHRARTKAR